MQPMQLYKERLRQRQRATILLRSNVYQHLLLGILLVITLPWLLRQHALRCLRLCLQPI